MRSVFAVNHMRIFLESRIIVIARCFLKRDNRFGIIHMVILVASASELMRAGAVERCVNAESERVKCVRMVPHVAVVYFLKTDSLNRAYSVCKILVNNRLLYAYRFEYLCGLI